VGPGGGAAGCCG